MYMEKKKIIFFDTTLRDWHQCPWAAIEKDSDYFDIVRWLDGIWFDICEVWFPSSSNHEAYRVNEVAKMCKTWEISTIVAWLTQMVDFQVEKTIRSLEPATSIGKWMFHIYFPVDQNLRMASVWDVTNNQAIERVAKFAKLAKDAWLVIQFSPEWYSKVWDNFDFCSDLLIAAAESWVTYFNMPDTIWWEDPFNQKKEYYTKTILRHKKIIDERFPWNKFIWSIHNHNDLWLATQNSITWLMEDGITKVEWTINWIWERAWNADLVQIIARMKTTLQDLFDTSHIDAKKITNVSQMVSKLMLKTQAHYPIVWENAMRHTSWWHTNAIIKNPTTYQPFAPEIVWSEISLVYWPNSWWNLAINIIEKAWYKISKDEKRKIDEYLKAKMQETWRYKWLTNQEVVELFLEYISPIKIDSYEKIWNNFKIYWDIFWEKQIDLNWETIFSSLKNYLSNIIKWFEVINYHSNSQTSWSDSIAISSVKINNENWEKYNWVAKDKDIEMAWLKALIDAYNKAYINKNVKK